MFALRFFRFPRPLAKIDLYAEKTKFVDLLIEQAEKKFTEQFTQIQMTPDEKKLLYDFNYTGLSALRDIKKIFNNRLMDFFASKGL